MKPMKLYWMNNNGGPEELYGPAHQTDAGLDLAVAHDVRILPGERKNIPCGISIALPEGTCGIVLARSSSNRAGLFCFTGLIDESYRGPLWVLVKNVSDEVIRVRKGDRIAQILVLPNILPALTIERVDELPEGERGAEGFGSTGGGVGEGYTLENDPELYFELRKEIVDGEVPEETKIEVEDYKGRIAKAVFSHKEKAESVEYQVREHLGINPNWENRTNSSVMDFLKSRAEAGQSVADFATWWWENDWRGQKKQPPTTVQIRELWPQAFGFSKKDNEDIDVRRLL